LINNVMGYLFDLVMRKPWNSFLQSQEAPMVAQEVSLRRILSSNKNTLFGKERDFARLANLTGRELWRHFRSSVPIASYEAFASKIELMKNGQKNVLIPGSPEMFSLTSGTTSEPKLCPVNRAFIVEHHRQHLIWMYKAFKDHPGINGGKYLVVASPPEMGRTAGGIPFGAMSGKQLAVQSIPVRRRMAAPVEVQLLHDSTVRWLNTILFALATPNLRVVTAVNPSSLLTISNKMGESGDELIERIASGRLWVDETADKSITNRLAGLFRRQPERAKRLAEILRVEGTLPPAVVWPELSMLFTWQGGSSSFYLPYVAASWGQAPQRCLGLRASEGTFSIPLRDNEPSGTLAVGGHVMEFIPAEMEEISPNTPTLLVNQLEIGKLYRMVVTTSGGFYRYDLADLVEVTGRFGKTPEIAFVRRAGSVLSVTGEKVTEDQVVGAMRTVSEHRILLNGYTLTWELDGEARYVLAVEWAGGEKLFFQRRSLLTEQLRNLLDAFDCELKVRNCEYEAKRNDGRLAAPRLILLADGTYRNYRSTLAKGGRPESQIKLPHLITPPSRGRAPVKGCRFFDDVRIIVEL